jgi:hypothetical protein
MLKFKKEMVNKEEEMKAAGMCASCAHQNECVMTHEGNGNFYGCAEYDAVDTPETTQYQQEAAPATAMGLCATCENKNMCMLNTTPGGVWNCEEFR